MSGDGDLLDLNGPTSSSHGGSTSAPPTPITNRILNSAPTTPITNPAAALITSPPTTPSIPNPVNVHLSATPLTSPHHGTTAMSSPLRASHSAGSVPPSPYREVPGITNNNSNDTTGGDDTTAGDDTSAGDDDDDDDDSEFDGPPLKKVVMRSCKRYDLGTAVLPKLLLQPDVDEIPDPEEDGLFKKDGGDIHSDGYRLAPSAPQQSRYARFVQQEFTAIVIEHHLKWAPLCTAEPGPLPDGKPVTDRLGRYDFGLVDDMVDWALERRMNVKGHVLIWAVTSPNAFLESMAPTQLREAMRRHIFTTMGHFRGRIKVWDVVNEALAPDGTLAPNIFLRKLGPTYIEECFRWAHQADPSAILLYNDNKVEGMGPDSPNPSKSEGFYNLLKDLKAKDVPIHGCGIQAHFNAAGVGRNRPPTPRMVQQQIHRLGELGLRVNISEMDVRVSKLSPNLRQIAQRQIYHDILAAALSEACFDGIWLWGFTDRHTWVSSFYYDDEPLILDEDYDRKEAYYGLREALGSLVPGGIVGGKGVVLDDDVDGDGNPWGHLWMQPEPDENGDGGERRPSNDAAAARPDWEQPDSFEDTLPQPDSLRSASSTMLRAQPNKQID